MKLTIFTSKISTAQIKALEERGYIVTIILKKCPVRV